MTLFKTVLQKHNADCLKTRNKKENLVRNPPGSGFSLHADSGVEIAYDLALKGKKPVIVEVQKDILQVPGLSAANSNYLREVIRYYGIPVVVNASLAGVTDADGFRVRIWEKDAAEERLLEADSCILSVGYVPCRQLADGLAASGYPADRIHVVGDAQKVENLMSVIWGSYELCYRL